MHCVASSDRNGYVCANKPNYPLSAFSVGNFMAFGVRASDNVAIGWGSSSASSVRPLVLEETGTGVTVLPPSSGSGGGESTSSCNGTNCVKVCGEELKYNGKIDYHPIDGDFSGTVLDHQTGNLYAIGLS